MTEQQPLFPPQDRPCICWYMPDGEVCATPEQCYPEQP